MTNIFNNILRGETWSIAADFTHIAHPFDEPNETQIKHQEPPLWDRIGGSVLFALSLILIIPGCFYLYWASKKIDVIDKATPETSEGKIQGTAFNAAPLYKEKTPDPVDPEAILKPPHQKIPKSKNKEPPEAPPPPETKNEPITGSQQEAKNLEDFLSEPLDATKISRFQLLEDVEELYKLSPHFTDQHWETLTDNQALAMASDKRITSDQFFKLFPAEGDKSKRLTLLFEKNPNAFYAITRHLDQNQWKLFEPKLAMQLNFHQIDEKKRQEAFDTALAPVLSQNPLTEEILNKIIELQNAKIETTSWWKSLNEEKILLIIKDFPNFISKQENKVFVSFFGYQGEETKALRLAQLGTGEKGMNALYALIPRFEPVHWKALSNEQILALDFSKIKGIKFELLKIITQEKKSSHRKVPEVQEKFKEWLATLNK